MIENNSTLITNEMIEVAYRCNNLELDRRWNEWVKQQIKKGGDE